MGIKVINNRKTKKKNKSNHELKRREEILKKVDEVPKTLSALQEKAKEIGLSDIEFLKKYSFEIAQPFNIVTKNKSFWSNLTDMSYWKRRKVANRMHNVNLIKMELSNGKHRTFLVSENNHGFYYMDRRYVFDEKVKYEDIDLGFWCYDFHEDFTLPFKRRFPVTDIKATLERSEVDGYEVAYATNPSVLERFVNSTVLEMLLRGGNLQKLLVIIMIVTIITGVLALLGFGIEGYYIYKIKKAIDSNNAMTSQLIELLSKGK